MALLLFMGALALAAPVDPSGVDEDHPDEAFGVSLSAEHGGRLSAANTWSWQGTLRRTYLSAALDTRVAEGWWVEIAPRFNLVSDPFRDMEQALPQGGQRSSVWPVGHEVGSVGLRVGRVLGRGDGFVASDTARTVAIGTYLGGRLGVVREARVFSPEPLGVLTSTYMTSEPVATVVRGAGELGLTGRFSIADGLALRADLGGQAIVVPTPSTHLDLPLGEPRVLPSLVARIGVRAGI